MSTLPDACDECGQVHSTTEPNTAKDVPACSGHLSRVRDDQGRKIRCRKQPVRGLSVCRSHGGSTERARHRAARVLGEQAEQDRLAKARRVAERFGLPIAIDPLTAIEQEMARSNGLIRFYEQKLAEFDDDKSLIFGVSKIEDIKAGQGRAGRNTTFEAKSSEWLILMNQERDRLGKLSIEAAKLGLEARRVAIRQEESRTLIAVLDGSLRALGFDPADRDVAAVVATQLRALQGGAA